jgi:bifunctional UDP-N-acetylglucosamine pyrophosphorylase/glucosamine-1-phosphate N-acetyltransferase
MARGMTHKIAAIVLAARTHEVRPPQGAASDRRAADAAPDSDVDALNPAKKVVVVGDKADQIETALAGSASAVQEPQLGTGHAVQQAEGALADFDGDVLILYGDVPSCRPPRCRR